MGPPSKHKGANTNGQRLKVVVRRLPADLPEEVFWKSVSRWVTRKDDTNISDRQADSSPERAVWSKFEPGKVQIKSVKATSWGKHLKEKHTQKDLFTNRMAKESTHSRAYIMFETLNALVAFHNAYNNWTFRDKRGQISQAIVEFAPFQKAPAEVAKKDPKQGTVELDADYLAFVNMLSAPDVPVVATDLNTGDKEYPKSTPLLDHLRAVKAAEKASKIAAKKGLSNKSAKGPNGPSKTRTNAKQEGAPSVQGKSQPKITQEAKARLATDVAKSSVPGKAKVKSKSKTKQLKPDATPSVPSGQKQLADELHPKPSSSTGVIAENGSSSIPQSVKKAPSKTPRPQKAPRPPKITILNKPASGQQPSSTKQPVSAFDGPPSVDGTQKGQVSTGKTKNKREGAEHQGPTNPQLHATKKVLDPANSEGDEKGKTRRGGSKKVVEPPTHDAITLTSTKSIPSAKKQGNVSRGRGRGRGAVKPVPIQVTLQIKPPSNLPT